MSEQRAQAFHVVTVVWGRSYVELFLDVAVPNQMTPGNLGALPAGSRYRVFTSPEDFETLAASSILARVNDMMPVDVIAMPELAESAVNPLDRLITAHRLALQDARPSRAVLVFLNADHFMSEGALAAVVRRHAAGSRAVGSTGVRLDKDTFIAALQTRGGVRSLASRDLVALALDHLHPFTLAHMIGGTRSACWPISVYWNVPGEGILARAFYLHSLMVDSACLDVLPNIDAKYLGQACPVPDEVHLVCDSDELCLFELSHADAAAIDTASGGISVWRAARCPQSLRRAPEILLASSGSTARRRHRGRVDSGRRAVSPLRDSRPATRGRHPIRPRNISPPQTGTAAGR